MIIVESMAQCGGAGVKQAGLTDGFFGLVSMEGVRIYKGVSYNQEIKYVIKNIRISSKLIIQSGKAYSNGDLLTEATWTCARLDK